MTARLVLKDTQLQKNDGVVLSAALSELPYKVSASQNFSIAGPLQVGRPQGQARTPVHPFTALAGGILIGLAATLLLVTTGRLAGVSGITCGVFGGQGLERTWRLAFIAGLISAGLVWQFLLLKPLPVEIEVRGWPLWLAGLLTGFGTRMSGGCTSGHGICGISRFSLRSVYATLTFIAFGMLTVWIRRHGG
jgi:uncharacterized protein